MHAYREQWETSAVSALPKKWEQCVLWMMNGRWAQLEHFLEKLSRQKLKIQIDFNIKN